MRSSLLRVATEFFKSVLELDLFFSLESRPSKFAFRSVALSSVGGKPLLVFLWLALLFLDGEPQTHSGATIK
jgi:hypothetical protein